MTGSVITLLALPYVFSSCDPFTCACILCRCVTYSIVYLKRSSSHELDPLCTSLPQNIFIFTLHCDSIVVGGFGLTLEYWFQDTLSCETSRNTELTSGRSTVKYWIYTLHAGYQP